MKKTIRTMVYVRSGTALVAAAEKGLKYGRKTGECVLNENKNDHILKLRGIKR